MKTRLAYLIGISAVILSIAVLSLVTLSANAASSSTPSVTWTDNFSDPVLDSRWSWIREDPTRWSLTERPGFMRIKTREFFSSVDNLLVQDAPPGYYEIRTRVVFTPTENYQIAGLLIYQSDGNSLRLGRAFCDAPAPTCVGNGIYFDYAEEGNQVGSNYATTTPVLGDVHLKVVRQGSVYTGYFSTDGVTWTLVGAHAVTISPTKVGLYASNQIQGASEINADFDFFTLTDDFPCCDLDGDGSITVVDIQRVARWWGWSVP